MVLPLVKLRIATGRARYELIAILTKGLHAEVLTDEPESYMAWLPHLLRNTVTGNGPGQ
jgi:hypothetical protein